MCRVFIWEMYTEMPSVLIRFVLFYVNWTVLIMYEEKKTRIAKHKCHPGRVVENTQKGCSVAVRLKDPVILNKLLVTAFKVEWKASEACTRKNTVVQLSARL